VVIVMIMVIVVMVITVKVRIIVVDVMTVHRMQCFMCFMQMRTVMVMIMSPTEYVDHTQEQNATTKRKQLCQPKPYPACSGG
jgi:hypothetical protein